MRTHRPRFAIVASVALSLNLIILASSLYVRAQQSSAIKKTPCIPDQTHFCKLTVKITTERSRGAGTNNAVYFDIGPTAWRLDTPHHNDFEAGAVDVFELETPDNKPIRKRDILWFRLQKKGLLGYTGLHDGFDGAWHPQSLEVSVDGQPLPVVKVDRPLNSKWWFWRGAPPNSSVVSPYSSAANFLHSLRIQKNKELNGIDKFTGFFTTPLFKKNGLSGWLKCIETREGSSSPDVCETIPERVCASGTVYFEPAKSTDGLATIDLEVDSITFCRKGNCTDTALRKDIDPERERYLRVEYAHKGNFVPANTAKVCICGALRWDTDREGWWEIHPRTKEDVTSKN
jgi:PLAT/LH2 domain-containing protein